MVALLCSLASHKSCSVEIAVESHIGKGTMFERYADFEYLLAQIQLVLFMLGMGATLQPRDFAEIVRRPGFLFLGAALQFLLAPALAVGLNACFGLDPGVAIGLIIVAAMPGGQMSKLFTYFARGNVALSVALTACGTLASLVTVPLLLDLLAGEYLRERDFAMPFGKVVRDMVLYLLLPLLGGLAFGRWQPAR